MNVENYINKHTDINYCEAIIHPDGTIEDARPSHIEALILYSNETKDELSEKMPMEASPISWLVDYTGCVSLWYDTCLLPETLNSLQLSTIKELIKNKIIKNPYIGKMLKEKSIIERNQRYIQTGEWYDIEQQEIIL